MFAGGCGRVLATAVVAATFGAAGLTAGLVMPAAAAGNNNPHAGNDKLAVAPGASGSIDVLRNDRSLDGFAAVTIEDPPSHGAASMSAAHVLTYTPAAGYRGPDSVVYSVTDDDGDRSDATVSITVGDNVHAVDDSMTGEAGQPLSIDVLANDSVSDGVKSLTITSPPTFGGASIVANRVVYTSAADLRGSDLLTYRVDDSDGDYDVATVDIAIYKGHAVTARSDVADAQVEDTTSIPVTNNDDVPDGIDQVQIDIDPADGEAHVVGNAISYTPSPGFQGSDSIWYTVIDSDGDRASSFVDIRVIDGLPVTARDDSVETTGPTTIDVIENDEKGDLPATVSVSDTSGEGGALSMDGNNIAYVPPPGFLGEDLIPYQLGDSNGDVAFGYVNVLVYAGENPVHAVDDEATVPVTTSPIDVLANDELRDGLDALQITTDPTNGDAWVDDDGQLFYTADPGATWDYLEYCVFDVDGDRGCGRVHIRIPGNEPSTGQPTIPPPPPPATATPPLTLTASLSKSAAPLKSLVTMSGKVSTAAATVTLQRQSGTSWVNVAAMAVRANGAYTFKVPTSARGRTTYSVKATDTNLTTTRSTARTLSVFSASITKVHAAGAEYVVVKNTGKLPIALRGMKLKDKHGKSLTLPAFTLPAGKSVAISTGKGKVTRTQLHVRKKLNLWSKHDVAKLVDSTGALVAQKKY